MAVTGPDDRDELPRAVTLGARLDADGRALLARRHTSPVWSGTLSTLLERVAALSRRRDRFERLEGRSSQDAVHLTARPRGPGPARALATVGTAALPGGTVARQGGELRSGPGDQPGPGSGDQLQPGSAQAPRSGGEHGPRTGSGQAPRSGGEHEPRSGGEQAPRSGGEQAPRPGREPEPRPGSAPLPSSPRSATASGPGRPLPADLRASLRRVTGLGADQLRVHTDGPADALARRHAADAVTVDRAVHFRSGRYRPDEPEGFGLLAHEVSHVWSGPAGADPRRADDLERTARRHERAGREAAQTATQRPAPVDLASGARPAAPAALPSLPDRVAERPSQLDVPAARPVAAPADREPGGAATAPLDYEALRRSLLDELRRQLRTESERGA